MKGTFPGHASISIPTLAVLASAMTWGPRASLAAEAVGYINVSLVQGKASAISAQLVSRPADSSGSANRVADLFREAPEGLELRWLGTDGIWQSNFFQGGTWQDPDGTLLPGGGVLAVPPVNQVVTFTGTVQQGELRRYIPAGASLVSSMIPVSGRLFADLAFPLADGVRISTLLPDGNWQVSGDIAGGKWTGAADPVIGVGQSFRVDAPRSFVWERRFYIDETEVVPRFGDVREGKAVSEGEALALQIPVTASPSARYQWRRNGVDIPGATRAELTIPAANLASAGDYQLVVFDGGYLVESPVVPVSVTGTDGPRLTLARAATGAGFVLRIAGREGVSVDVQWSPDFRSWHDLESGVGLPGSVDIDRVPGVVSAFFRIRVR